MKNLVAFSTAHISVILHATIHSTAMHHTRFIATHVTPLSAIHPTPLSTIHITVRFIIALHDWVVIRHLVSGVIPDRRERHVFNVRDERFAHKIRCVSGSMPLAAVFVTAAFAAVSAATVAAAFTAASAAFNAAAAFG